MQVILLESDKNLGDLGSIVNVKAGYARNFLLPQNKAKFASKVNLELFEKQKDELIAKAGNVLDKARQQAEKMADLVCVISTKVGDEGKLFGSVGTQNIVKALEIMGHTIQKRDIKMPNGLIRHVGEYEVDVALHNDITITIKVNIVAE